MSDRQERFDISPKTSHEFIDQSHIMKLEAMGVVQCGIATCRDFFTVFRKNQQKHMLLYTVKGRGWLSSGDCRYQLEAGSVISVPAGVENGFGIEEEDWQIAWVFLTTKQQWPHLNLNSTDIEYQLVPTAEILHATIMTLLRTRALPMDLGAAIADKASEQLKLLINTPNKNQQSRNEVRINNVFNCAQRQLHKDWTVKQLSALFPCSEPHFHRLCQHFYGHSPKVHLTRMRMEYAARLLSSTEWSIQHVGEIVGYPNPANFSTRYKTWSRMTPREFRKQNTPAK